MYWFVSFAECFLCHWPLIALTATMICLFLASSFAVASSESVETEKVIMLQAYSRMEKDDGMPKQDFVQSEPEQTMLEDEQAMTADFFRSRDSNLVGMTDEEVLQYYDSEPGMCPGQEKLADVKKPFRPLAFIHIPRTGGTTIEDCTGEEDPVELRWGRHAHLWHSGEPHWCSLQHWPPSELSYYNDKETFCVVRDPYTRLMSQYRSMITQHFSTWGKDGRDSADVMNEQLLEKLQKVKEKPTESDCHFLPQAAYVFGWDKDTETVTESKKHCDNMLRFEDEWTSFNSLMVDHGYSYEMIHRDTTSKFNLTVEDLSDQVVQLYNEIVEVDFRLLNYEKRSTR